VTWDEVAAGLPKKALLAFEADDVLVRVKKCGDLFEPVLKLKQKLRTIESLNEQPIVQPTRNREVPASGVTRV
jgi:hypothetical protein